MMFDKEQIVQDAVEAVIERTDIDPGEVNRNIKKVMQTMDEANEQFALIQQQIQGIRGAAEELDSSSTEMAEAGVEMAKGAQSLGEAVNELESTQNKLSEDMNDLKDTLDRLEDKIPEEE